MQFIYCFYCNFAHQTQHKQSNTHLTMQISRFFASAAMLLLGMGTMQAEIIISADAETTLKVAEVSSMTFDGDFNTGNLVVHYTDGTTSTTPIANIQQISFKAEDNPQVGILNAKAQSLAVKGNFVFITSEGGHAFIFDVQGRNIQATRLSSGTTVLSLDSLPVGNYIINVNGQNVKFQKK